jgi:hypothetical protein
MAWFFQHTRRNCKKSYNKFENENIPKIEISNIVLCKTDFNMKPVSIPKRKAAPIISTIKQTSTLRG